MIKRKFGMACLSISQGRFNDFSHKNLNAYDLNGMDTGVDRFRTFNDLEVVGIQDYNTTGFANTVLFYDKENDVTLAMTHCNSIPSGCYVGNVFHAGDTIYYEGKQPAKGATAPTGNHIHLEIGRGKQEEKEKINGIWQLRSLINIEDYFYIDSSYTTVRDDGGYIFSYDIESEEHEMINKDQSKGVYGVDLSTYDKNTIDWEKLAKVAKFAILRCGFGADRDGQHDDTFFDFCRKCDEYGIKKGAYIYSYAENEQEAINEANHIIRLCNEAGGDFPIGLFLDMEDKLQSALPVETNTKNVLAYINQIWTTPYKAGFYSMQSFCNNKVDMSRIVGNAIVWVANFGSNDGYYHDITTNFEYDIRQYTSINADKDFSNRSGLDQNLHFAYDAYIETPEVPMPEPTPDPGVPDEEYEALKKEYEDLQVENGNLKKQIDEMAAKIETLTIVNDDLELKVDQAIQILEGEEE